MPVEPSYAFNTFNTMGASNGSGVEMTDSFEDFRKKTNGIINQIEDFAVAPVAYGLVTWTLTGNTPTFSIENSFNVKEIGFNDSTGIRIDFDEPTKDSNFMPYGNLGSRDSTISPSGWGSTSEGRDTRNKTDFGTVVVPPQVNIKFVDENQLDISKVYSIKLGNCVPFRSQSWSKKRNWDDGPMFYSNPNLPVRTQEQILIDSAYPCTNQEPENFWGLTPAI